MYPYQDSVKQMLYFYILAMKYNMNLMISLTCELFISTIDVYPQKQAKNIYSIKEVTMSNMTRIRTTTTQQEKNITDDIK